MSNILIVEDDLGINNGVKFNLEMDGFKCFSATSILEGKKIFDEYKIDLILLDINLPDGSGFNFCRDVRNSSNVPIIFLTACDLEVDQVIGFKVGGDDYITKPFSVSILNQRIQAVLRRSKVSKVNSNIKTGEFTLDLEMFSLMKNDEQIVLAPTEFKIMKIFMENKGQVLTRENLLSKLWNDDIDFVEEHTLTVNINRLRGKIEDNPKKPKFIKTVYGMGYIWTVK